MSESRTHHPKRFRAARRDCTVARLRREIAATYGLPVQSITIRNPNGRAARSDKSVGRLRDDFSGYTE